MQSIERQRESLPATIAATRTELAKIVPGQMDVMIGTRDSRRALAEALAVTSRTDAALRVAEMTINCAGALDDILGTNGSREMMLNGMPVTVERLPGFRYQVTVTKLRGREVYTVQDDGSVDKSEFNDAISAEGRGTIAPTLSGAALFHTAKRLLAEHGAAKLQVN